MYVVSQILFPINVNKCSIFIGGKRLEKITLDWYISKCMWEEEFISIGYVFFQNIFNIGVMLLW